MKTNMHPLYSETRVRALHYLIAYGSASSSVIKKRIGYKGARSLSHHLRTLKSEGFVTVTKERDPNHLTAKNTYTATPKGREAFQDMVELMWELMAVIRRGA